MLVDSTVLVDVTRGSPEALARAERRDVRLFVSEMTRTEVLVEMRSHERSTVASAFAALSWLPVDEEVPTRAGDLGRTYRASHHLGVADLLIGATALVHGLELVTSNVEHYPMFDGLAAPTGPSRPWNRLAGPGHRSSGAACGPWARPLAGGGVPEAEIAPDLGRSRQMLCDALSSNGAMRAPARSLTGAQRRSEPGGVAWMYLVGGDADGQFFEADLTSASHPDGSGAAMVRGPGR